MKKVYSIFLIISLLLSYAFIADAAELKSSIALEENDILISEEDILDSAACEKADKIRGALCADSRWLPYFGGCHIDSNKNLLVFVVENNAQFIAFCKDLIGTDRVEYCCCDYSLQELKLSQKHIEDSWFSLNDEDELNIYISSVSLREDLNRIVVHLIHGNSDIIAAFKRKIADSEEIAFEFVDAAENQAMKAGEQISMSGNSYSIGYRAYKVTSSGNYIYGFITASHGVGVGTSVYLPGVSSSIGYVSSQSYYEGGVLDTCFVAVTNGSVSNQTHEGISLSGGYISSFTSGSTVYKSGYVTNQTAGSIISTSTSFRDQYGGKLVRDCVSAGYYSLGGDSGGVVFAMSGGTYKVAGQHFAAETSSVSSIGYFVKASNIAPVLGVNPY